MDILSKLVINKLKSKLITFIFSITNIFIIKAINKPRIVVLFKVKKTLTKCIKDSLLVLNSSLVYFLNSHL